MSLDAAIIADAVAVTYPGGGAALGPVSLELRAGEIVSVLGPSGCGKSTLLLALAGLLAPSAGCVVSNGPRPGVVFQDPTLMPWASVLENVALPLRVARAADALEQARRALAAVGLPDVAQRRPAALSGGMRMRVSLARALVGAAQILLLDEPFAAIDELGRRSLDDLILDLKSTRGIGALFVTHSVEEAVYLGDRVLVMSPRPGRFVADIPVAAPLGPRGAGFFDSAAFREAAAAARAGLGGAGAHEAV